MAKSRKPSYAEALAELEEIVSGIETESTDVDQLTEQVKRARYLIGYCKGKLRSTEESVRKVLTEIETEAGPSGKAKAKAEPEPEEEEPEEEEEIPGTDEGGENDGLF